MPNLSDRQKPRIASGFKPSPPPPIMLGNGAAAQVDKKLQGRHAQIEEAMGYANGGMVRGPGTGTSDDIETEVPEGSYIMPADSTATIGKQKLKGLGFQPGKVPVRLSNGEYELPPEQVHAVGVRTLEQMKSATHAPVPEPRGFKPQHFFANGGVVDPLYVDPDGVARRNLGPANTRTINVDPRGNASIRNLPATQGGRAVVAQGQPTTLSQSRALVPAGKSGLPATVAQPSIAQPAGKPDFYGYRDGATTRVNPRTPIPSAQAAASLPPPQGKLPPPPKPAGFQPNYQARAETMARAKADTAAFEADRARNPGPTARGTGPTASPAAISPSAAQPAGFKPRIAAVAGKVGNVVNKFGPAATALSVLPALASSRNEDSTARYAERFGVSEPTGDGSVGDIAKFAGLRAGGFATDLASNLSLGLADNLYRDKQGERRAPAGFVPSAAASPVAPDAMTEDQADVMPDGVTTSTTSVPGIARLDGVQGAPNLFTDNPQRAIADAQGSAAGFNPIAAREARDGRLNRSSVSAPVDLQQDFRVRGLDGQSVSAAGSGYTPGGIVIGDDTGINPNRPGFDPRAFRIAARAQELAQQGDEARMDAELRGQDLADRRTAGAEDRQIQREQLGIDREARGFQTAAARRLERLYQEYELAAPEERAAIAQQIRDISGKEQPNRFTVVPGGQEIDPTTNLLRTLPSQVINNQSGQFVQQHGATNQSPPPLPAGLKVGAATKQADGSYSAAGRTITIKNGKVAEII